MSCSFLGQWFIIAALPGLLQMAGASEHQQEVASEYTQEVLALRLRRLEEENAALHAEADALRAALPACVSFVQTGGCDPDGPVELKKGCADNVPRGASGFCECHGGRKVARVAC